MLGVQVFGKVWTAPSTSIKIDDIVGTVNKELMEKELKLKNQKGPNKRPKPGSAPKAGAAGVVTVEDDDVWSIPSEDEPIVLPAAGKSGKAAKSSAEKDAAQAARQEAKEKRERAQSWKKEIAKASRCMGPLNSTTSSLTSLVDKDAKQTGILKDELSKGLKEAQKNLSDLKTCALTNRSLYILNGVFFHQHIKKFSINDIFLYICLFFICVYLWV